MDDPGVSVILSKVASGDRRAADQLLPLVYSQLRAAAQNAMNNERKDHTLQATALVHEAYAKLVGGQPIDWANRAHFYDAAARAMRQILIDHARSRNAEKRGGGARKQELTDFAAAFDSDSDQILALDAALSRLETEDAEIASVVRFRFFAGLSGDETAQALGVSARKVDMMWARARAWLFRELESETR
ncbi:MAG: sigma-70 family RNA polymerase sigma factor [Phycisphaerales bacterium]|nr:sigma-70 family RNA polymerase sigma factor [Phycisphaerales bacterium]